jgi:hypothetical protein
MLTETLQYKGTSEQTRNWHPSAVEPVLWLTAGAQTGHTRRFAAIQRRQGYA